MSKWSGEHSNFEKDFRTRFLPLERRLTKIENELEGFLRASVKGAKKSNAYWNSVIRNVEKIYGRMDKVFSEWAIKEIPARYRRSLRLIRSRITADKAVVETARKGLVATMNSNAATQISAFLYKSAADTYLQSLAGGEKAMKRFLRQTQQVLVNESLVEITIAQGLELGDLRKAANALSGQLWGELWNDVEGKKFVQAGRYKYKPSYYAELVARTKFHEAHSQATFTEAANHGTDLVEISSHNTSTAICLPFEGKVYSVSGTHKLFPPIQDVPPFHPNCLHLMFPTFESAMRVQGTLESWSAFSKGEISKPPVPAGFVPVDKRKVG